MKAEDLMTRNVCTCSKEDSLEQAARLMWESDVGCLVVTDAEQKPIGMITDRDITMAAYTQGVRLQEARVESAMAKQVSTCSTSTSLNDVERAMQTAQIRRVPVVDGGGKLRGIVTLGDIARSSQSSAVRMAEIPGLAKTLASITERRPGEAAAAQ
jgi:CBS domain-containing protein